MSHLDIVSDVYGHRKPKQTQVEKDLGLITEMLPGRILTMKNGEVWFHPYTGNRGAPWRLK